jgi:hypothetical protein
LQARCSGLACTDGRACSIIRSLLSTPYLYYCLEANMHAIQWRPSLVRLFLTTTSCYCVAHTLNSHHHLLLLRRTYIEFSPPPPVIASHIH